MSFINKDFILKGKTAKKLYHSFAENMPIVDYHCHLSPKMIAENYKFKNAYDLFLGGDHYKWRQMRTAGIDEAYITGDKDDFEKFKKFASVMPMLIGNPIYHWTHLELKRYFGIDDILTADTAEKIWDKCNELLAKDEFSAQNLILNSNVEIICTTDDPADDLCYHKQLKESNFKCKVLPTFRPDKCVEINKPGFDEYIARAGIETFEQLLQWLSDRIAFFHDNGCRLADHALEIVPFGIGDASAVFEAKKAGNSISEKDENIYKTAVLSHCAKEYTKLGWTMQLHIGALRNNNSIMFEKLGPDTGFDSINDLCIAQNLSLFLNNLEKEDQLPKTILYTLNPKDNYVLGTMLGNFQKAPVKCKIQFGSGWWFNDNKDGMEQQMKALANLGMLGAFVGMLTDSRSFVSYTRHEYFRRILCNMIGEWVDNGEYPADWKNLEKIVKGICYNNAKEYFNF